MTEEQRIIKLLAEVWMAGNVSDLTPDWNDLPHVYFGKKKAELFSIITQAGWKSPEELERVKSCITFDSELSVYKVDMRKLFYPDSVQVEKE